MRGRGCVLAMEACRAFLAVLMAGRGCVRRMFVAGVELHTNHMIVIISNIQSLHGGELIVEFDHTYTHIHTHTSKYT